MATTYLKKTFDGAEASSKGTISFWMKRSKLGAEQMLYINTVYNSSWQSYGQIRINSDDTLRVRSVNSGSSTVHKITSMKFVDTNCWYHIVVALDYGNASSANYQKIYVNGNELTEFTTNSNPSSTNNFFIGSDLNGQRIGSADNAQYFDGYLSHYHCVVGTVYTPSTFGETDSTTGEWKIKTNPGISTANYGAAGFFILKDGNSLTDQSGNGNNFTLGGGILTKSEDCPSNVFCTINRSNSYWAAGTFVYGNNVVTLPNKSGAWNLGTLGMTSGKYYWEIKCTGTSNGAELQLGIADKAPGGNTGSGVAGTAFGYNANGEYGIYAYNGAFIGNAVANPYTSWGSATTNGIAMIAVDLDNNKFYGGVNGTWFASGNPATGANGKTIQAVASTVDGCYYPAVGTYQGYDGKVECNFGNGYFADNAVSSAGTNASGNGIFEYDVPSGFTALSTKGLNL